MAQFSAVSGLGEITDRMRRALTASHTTWVEVDVLRAGQTVARNIPITSGSVSGSRTGSVRRTCRLTVTDVPTSHLPSGDGRSPLDPWGNELVIRRGIRYPDTTTETITQGVFGISGSKVNRFGDVDLTGEDRAGRIGKWRFLTPFGVAAGTGVMTAVTSLAQTILPGVEVVDLTALGTSTLVATALDEATDPWTGGVATWADQIGADAAFDRAGRLVVREVPDLRTQPVAWQLVEGPDCVITDLTATLTDSVPNAVLVIGDAAGTAGFSSTSIDADPTSPTWYGPDVNTPQPGYGPRVVSIRSSLITSQAQADALAAATGRRLFGQGEQIAVSLLPANPALSEGDLVHVRRAGLRVDRVYVVDRLELPLGAGAMSLTCTQIRRATT